MVYGHAMTHRGWPIVFVIALLPACGTADAPTIAPPPADAPCPTDELAAIGTPCAPEGRICGATATSMRAIMCTGGMWVELSIAPPPSLPPPSSVPPAPVEPPPAVPVEEPVPPPPAATS